MKVLIIHCSYKIKGGEDTVVEEEIKLMHQHGITTKLLEFNNSNNALLKLLQLPFNIFSYSKTKETIKNFKPDIVHIHNLHYAGSASVIYAIKKCKIPFVVTLHNYRLLCPSATLYFNKEFFLDSLHQSFPWTAIKKGVYKNSSILTFWLSVSTQLHKQLGTWRHCSCFIVLSNDSQKIFKESYIGLYKKRIVVKPNFTSADFDTTAKQDDYFFYAGRLSEEKGIDILLDAFSKCKYRIKIAGHGDLEHKVIDYSNRFTNIEFEGSLQKKDVLNRMQSCTALVFPSVWFEGMPLTIIEAFACNTPVIASSTGVMLHMITDSYNGIFFKAGNSDDLANALHKWQALPDDKKNLYKKNARETYEKNYSPDVNAKQLLTIYEDVINDKKLNYSTKLFQKKEYAKTNI